MTTTTSHIALEPGSDPRLARVCRLVGPHAISLVTTVSPAGIANMAPFSFAMACEYEPPMIYFELGAIATLKRRRPFDYDECGRAGATRGNL